MKKKNFSIGNIVLVVFLVLLLIPQTRTPIQVGVNKLKMLVFSPSAMDAKEQTQLDPFDYLVTDINGSSEAISVGKGKVTFLSYWATWCPPCIAELPSIQKLYADYGDKMNFVLLTNEDPAIVRRFIKKKGYELPIYFPEMETPEKLYSNSLPTNYVIDAQGKIIVKEKGAADWNSVKVRELLDGLNPD